MSMLLSITGRPSDASGMPKGSVPAKRLSGISGSGAGSTASASRMKEGSEWITTVSSLGRSISVSGCHAGLALSDGASMFDVSSFLGLLRTFSTTTGSVKIS